MASLVAPRSRLKLHCFQHCAWTQTEKKSLNVSCRCLLVLYPALCCTEVTNGFPASCCRMPKASSSSPKGSWGSTFRSVGETLEVLPDLFPIWKVIFTLTCGLVVTGLMICGVVGWEQDWAWTLFWGGRTSLLKNKFIDSECRSWRGRVECKGPMDSELLLFSVLVNMSVLLLQWLWLWSLVLGSLFSNRHSCSREVMFRDISWVSWKYPGFIYKGIKGKKLD